MFSTLPERRACYLLAFLVTPVAAFGENENSTNAPAAVDGAVTASPQSTVTPIPVGRIVPPAMPPAEVSSGAPAAVAAVPQPLSEQPALSAAQLQPLAQVYSDPLGALYGQPTYPQPMDPAYGQLPDPAFGQGMDLGYGTTMDPGYGQMMDPGYGQYMDPGFGQSFDYGYAPGGAGSYGQGQYPYPDNSGGYPPLYPSSGSPQRYGSPQMSGYNQMDDYHLHMLERLDAIVNRLERIEWVLREGNRQDAPKP